MKKIILLLGSLIASSTYADTASIISDEKCPPVVTYEDIETPLKDLSPTEKLKAYRQRLEEKNLVLLEKKMEMIRLQQEMALLRNLEKSINQTISNLEKM